MKFLPPKVMLIALLSSGPTWAMEDHHRYNPGPSLRDRVWHYLTNGASISTGAGGRAISLEVQRLETEDRGKLVDQDDNALFLSYNLKANYFGNSRFGYNWMFNLSSFELDQQETRPEYRENLGTQVSGYFAYAVPAFFYNFGDRYHGTHLRMGIGLGLGVAEFQGDIILTESERTNDRANISNGPSNLFFAGGLFIEAQWDYFTFQIATAGPSLEYNGYKIHIADNSIMMGFVYPL